MNHAALVGQVLESELREVNGKKLLKLRVKTPTVVVREEGPKVFWDYHSVVLWGKGAEAAHSGAPKGATVSVLGRISTRSYERDGRKQYVTEINASEVAPVDLHVDGGPTEGADDEE